MTAETIPDVSRETNDRLARFHQMLLAENQHQNLISKSSEADSWQRHVMDGVQLARFGRPGDRWCDIGSGPGLPGLVIAIVTGDPMLLIEPRPRRCDFLKKVVDELALTTTGVFEGKVERVSGQFECITARAVAKAGGLFAMAHHLAHDETVWILPKGQSAQSELDEARMTWQGVFRLEPSLTSAAASILLAEKVRPRGDA